MVGAKRRLSDCHRPLRLRSGADLIRPGIGGGSDPWRGWSHVSTEEVPPRAS
jgi:hypothetical protein